MIRAIKSRMDIVLGFFAGQIISLILTVSFLVLNSALKESMVSVKRSSVS